MFSPRILLPVMVCFLPLAGGAIPPNRAKEGTSLPAEGASALFVAHPAIMSPPGYLPAQQADKQKASVWMKAKIDYSRGILAGLTEADFVKIRKNAESLNIASNLEFLYRTDVPGYKQQIILFVAANDNLIRQAEDRNLLGATLAFNQLTVSCVQCHQLVRDAKK